LRKGPIYYPERSLIKNQNALNKAPEEQGKLQYFHIIAASHGARNIVVGTVWLRAGRSEFQMPVGTKDLSLLQKLSTASGTNQASYSRNTRVKANGT